MLALKHCDFRLAASLRLGDPLPFAAGVSTCECNANIDRRGYHLLTCKFGGGPVWALNCVVSGWAECVRDAGLVCKVEPRYEYVNNDNLTNSLTETAPFAGTTCDFLEMKLA